METTTEGYFDGFEQHPIYFKIWQPVQPTARVIAIHGLGEHINRYNPIFTAFAQAGILVKGLDYTGHGKTFAKTSKKQIKGHTLLNSVFEDLLILAKHSQLENEVNLPTFIFGHSLGGLMALSFTQNFYNNFSNFKGVISQAPALRPAVSIPAYAKIALKLTSFGPIARFTDANTLDLDGLTSDESIRLAYQNDTLVHDRISLGLLADITDASKQLMTDGKGLFTFPVLIAHSKSDIFTDFKASEEFISLIPSTDKTFKVYSDVKHELHNEPGIRDALVEMYIDWINARKRLF